MKKTNLNKIKPIEDIKKDNKKKKKEKVKQEPIILKVERNVVIEI